jgi:uncharacterized protein DUF955
MGLTDAERLLQELGITEPNEIDVNAIAFHTGACVRHRALEGCEARIIGTGARAIITVNSASNYHRKRFSIAHELGHWHHHRGQCLVCRADEYRPRDGLSPERIADSYAADLLMPNYLFRPLAWQHAKLTFKAVSALAETFSTSQTATAIRFVESDHTPALLICHGSNGRKWFTRAPCVPTKWFPQDNLSAESFAFGVLFGQRPDDAVPRRIRADAWFDRREAERFEVHEQTFRTGSDEILSLVFLSDVKMLEDGARHIRRFRSID